MADEILRDYQHVVSSFTLIMGDKGVFDVRVDGELIYSKHAEGRHAYPEEVGRLFREYIGPDVPTYS